jgi:hypothetical protein
MDKPTLNRADLKLLKSVFATKKDLNRFATKGDIDQRFDQFERILLATFKELEEKFVNRILRLEEVVGLTS